jgi:hypothetical protein
MLVGVQLTLTEVTALGAVTEMEAVPDLLVSCAEVAVIVDVPTPEGEKRPPCVMEPLDAE